MNNQGLIGNLTQTNTPSYVDGKLGKALSSGGYKMTAEQTAQVLNNEAVSICFWIYVNAETGTSRMNMIFGKFDMGTNNNRKFSLINYPTANDLHWSWMNDTANNEFTSGVLSGVLPSYQWTHVAVTYQNPNGTVYINGEKVTTFTGVSNSSSFAYETQVISNSSYLRWNDYRIYNECISAKTVKEISKGLVCHYKLSGIGGENYFINSNDGVSYTSTENSTYTDVRMIINNDFWTKDNHNNYAVSFDWEISKSLPETKFCALHWCASPWYGLETLVIPANTTSGHYEYIGNNIPAKDFSTDNIFLRIGSTAGVESSWLAQNPGITFKLKNYKLEIGSKTTPWCPNPSDTLYSTLGYNDGIEYDCSGYGNNGTKVGTIAWSGDSVRYSGSYGFDGDTSAVKTNFYDYTLDGIFTINMWFRKNTGEWSSKVWETLFGGQSGFEIESKNRETNSPIIYAYSWGKGTFAYELDKWNMLTVVRTTSDTKWYLNGELKLTGTSGTIPSGEYFIGAWKTSTQQNYKGNISDFRVYATALSESDIKSLYSISASIDKTGVLSAYEFIEEG